MKTTIIALLFSAVSISLSAQTDVNKDFKQLHQLLGKWVRTNTKPGSSGGENWHQLSPTKLKGLGYSIKGTDTTFKENMSLEIQGNDINYIVAVTGSPKPVVFKVTQVFANGFVCENAANDFPKKITYNFTGNEIKAVISGGGNPVEFLFRKL